MPKWLRDAVFYEIYPQTFCDSNGDGIGDINGIISKLDYVQSLGCNAIWLNPVYDSPFMDAGYDVRNYYKVAARYGTNEDLKHLFAVAHEKITPRDGNYMVNYFSSQPALNYGFNKITHPAWQKKPSDPDCIATREALKDIMRFWLKMGCDGFRVDMADSLVKGEDGEKPETCKIWRNVREMLDKEFPEAALVSEWCNPKVSIGAGFHSDFYLDHDNNGYRFLFRDKDNKTGECKAIFGKNGKGDITKFLEEYLDDLKGTKGKGYISFITCNHDTPRMTRLFTPLEAKLAYTFVFLMPGVPFLYYGDEIGMPYREGLNSKEGGYSRTGTRTPMQWDSSPNCGFSAAPSEDLYLPVDTSEDAVTVEKCERDPDSILNTLRKVIDLRHSNEDLQSDGDFEVIYAEKNTYPFIFKRGQFVIAVNPTAKEQKAPFEFDGEEVFVIGKACAKDKQLTMQPQSLVVLQLQ